MLADYQTKFGLPTGTIHRFLLVFMKLDFLKEKKQKYFYCKRNLHDTADLFVWRPTVLQVGV